MSHGDQRQAMSGGGGTSAPAFQSNLMENIKERLLMQKANQEAKGSKHLAMRQKSPEYLKTQTSMNSLLGSEKKRDLKERAEGGFGNKVREKFIPISSPKSGSKEKSNKGDQGKISVETEERRRCGNSDDKLSSSKKKKKTLNYNSIQAASLSQLKQSFSRQQIHSNGAQQQKAGMQANQQSRCSHNRSDSRENNCKSRTSAKKKAHTSMSLHETGSGGKRKLLSNSAFVGLGPSINQRTSEQFQSLPTEADSNYLSSLNKVKYNNFFKNISASYSGSKKPRHQSPVEQEKNDLLVNKMASRIKMSEAAADNSMRRTSSSATNNIELAEIEKMIDDYISRTQHPVPEKNLNVSEYFQDIFPFLNNLSEKHEFIGSIFQRVRALFEKPCRKMIEQISSLKQFYRLHRDSAMEVEVLHQEKAALQKELSALVSDFSAMKKKLEACQSEAKSNAKGTTGYVILLEEKLRKIAEENEKLKMTVKKQRIKLADFQIKEEKIMRLLYAIRITGVNIEAVYDEYVRTPKSAGQAQQHQMKGAGGGNTKADPGQPPQKMGSMVTEDSILKESSSPNEWDDMLVSSQHEDKDQDCGAENKDSSEALRIKHIKGKAQGRLDERNPKETGTKQTGQIEKRLELKKQLRLDLSALRGDSGSFVVNQSLPGQLNNSQKNLIIQAGIPQKGFHEEFMAKISEFSESWRQAALLEKKF